MSNFHVFSIVHSTQPGVLGISQAHTHIYFHARGKQYSTFRWRSRFQSRITNVRAGIKIEIQRESVRILLLLIDGAAEIAPESKDRSRLFTVVSEFLSSAIHSRSGKNGIATFHLSGHTAFADEQSALAAQRCAVYISLDNVQIQFRRAHTHTDAIRACI